MREMTPARQVGAARDHLRRVRTGRRPTGEQIHVALSGHVKLVSAVTAQTAVGGLKPGAAQGTTQLWHGFRSHRAALRALVSASMRSSLPPPTRVCTWLHRASLTPPRSRRFARLRRLSCTITWMAGYALPPLWNSLTRSVTGYPPKRPVPSRTGSPLRPTPVHWSVIWRPLR